MQETIKFKRTLGKTGDSTMSTYPPELLEWINAKQGDTITLSGFNGKHGKYIAIWREQDVDKSNI